MSKKSFVFNDPIKGHYQTQWQAPSNIALVKYWGKHGQQLPQNPSISFTLSQCVTTTAVSFSPRQTGETAFDFLFEQKKQPAFHPKIQQFLERITPYFPALERHRLSISSQNSFPHSSGIASSASAMAVLALCIVDFEKQFHPLWTEEAALQKASFLARLGSGSAARSIAGPLMVWGQSKAFPQSNDHYAIAPAVEWHPIFHDYQDTVLIVDKGQKKVSSTLGHGLMQGHPFAAQRFEQAHSHLEEIKAALTTGDLERFIDLTEAEALTLHAMMMTSNPRFVLMQPNTLALLQKVWDFRAQTDLPLCFTLDAGANVHLLYPRQDRNPIMDFIQKELLVHCQQGQYIEDQVGNGAKKN
ncbi:MAG: diphosphomevalonate decarboxylase [Flavobacteriaceae bacterium]|nr:diphosphomevalonate decarboxylase [Flavobacteriaceae bacterium]